MGLNPGDEILSIDGKSTRAGTPARLDEAIRDGRRRPSPSWCGPIGSDRPVVRRITRTAVHVPAASPGVLLDGGVGYVVLHRMSEGAADELRAAVDRLRGEGMKALVLDLRSNPGGLIREGVKVAGLFLQPGDTVATQQGRSAKRPRAYLADDSADWDDLRLALLVNRGTASSAEVIAGALQDHDRAVIVGTPTYGKGVLQTTYPLGEEVALKLTTARWFTPSGRRVQRPPAQAAGGAGNRTPALEPQVLRTRAGRPIPDQSGILPDLTVRASLRSDGERVLLLRPGRRPGALPRRPQRLRGRAARRRQRHRRVVPGDRRPCAKALYARLVEAGVQPVPGDLRGGVAPTSPSSSATRSPGSSSARESVVRRQAKADRQLQAALRLLRGSHTQQETITAAVRPQASGRAR